MILYSSANSAVDTPRNISFHVWAHFQSCPRKKPPLASSSFLDPAHPVVVYTNLTLFYRMYATLSALINAIPAALYVSASA